MTGSLAYRKNSAAILRGEVPEKYARLLPYITGASILEIGSAEGVLTSLLARKGRRVTGLEANKSRHEAAIALNEAWMRRGSIPQGPYRFINGTIQDNLDLLKGHNTLVAVRVIYYLRDDLDTVFAEVAKHIPNVVLCGNRNRASWWRQGIPDRPDGPVNYYASHEGMRALLERHGYSIAFEEIEGDPIVIGRKCG